MSLSVTHVLLLLLAGGRGGPPLLGLDGVHRVDARVGHQPLHHRVDARQARPGQRGRGRASSRHQVEPGGRNHAQGQTLHVTIYH